MYLERLRRVYGKLCKSHLVQYRNTDIHSINHFEDLLNESLPANNTETEVKITMRKLYYADRLAYLNLIKKEPYFILITDVKDIVTHFDLSYTIFIKYNHTYKVTLFLSNLMRG